MKIKDYQIIIAGFIICLIGAISNLGLITFAGVLTIVLGVYIGIQNIIISRSRKC